MFNDVILWALILSVARMDYYCFMLVWYSILGMVANFMHHFNNTDIPHTRRQAENWAVVLIINSENKVTRSNFHLDGNKHYCMHVYVYTYILITKQYVPTRSQCACHIQLYVYSWKIIVTPVHSTVSQWILISCQKIQKSKFMQIGSYNPHINSLNFSLQKIIPWEYPVFGGQEIMKTQGLTDLLYLTLLCNTSLRSCHICGKGFECTPPPFLYSDVYCGTCFC